MRKIIEENKINELISKFELENLRNIKAKFLSGGQKKISNRFITFKWSKCSSFRWMFCGSRCPNNKNVTRNYRKLTKWKKYYYLYLWSPSKRLACLCGRCYDFWVIARLLQQVHHLIWLIILRRKVHTLVSLSSF